MKNLLERFKSKSKKAEEIINELEDRSIKIIQSEEKKEKAMKKMNVVCITPSSTPT